MSVDQETLNHEALTHFTDSLLQFQLIVIYFSLIVSEVMPHIYSRSNVYPEPTSITQGFNLFLVEGNNWDSLTGFKLILDRQSTNYKSNILATEKCYGKLSVLNLPYIILQIENR